jgi:hypothetical protein
MLDRNLFEPVADNDAAPAEHKASTTGLFDVWAETTPPPPAGRAARPSPDRTPVSEPDGRSAIGLDRSPAIGAGREHGLGLSFPRLSFGRPQVLPMLVVASSVGVSAITTLVLRGGGPPPTSSAIARPQSTPQSGAARGSQRPSRAARRSTTSSRTRSSSGSHGRYSSSDRRPRRRATPARQEARRRGRVAQRSDHGTAGRPPERRAERPVASAPVTSSASSRRPPVDLSAGSVQAQQPIEPPVAAPARQGPAATPPPPPGPREFGIE